MSKIKKTLRSKVDAILVLGVVLLLAFFVEGCSGEYGCYSGENHAPYFTSTAPTNAMEGVAFSYNPTYVDDDSPKTKPGHRGYVTCAVSRNTCGAWLSFIGCNASGTPSKWGSCDYLLTLTDGKGATAQQIVNLLITPSSGWESKISAGMFHSCALTQAGGVKCWGQNEFGQVGDGTSGKYNIRPMPVEVKGLTSGVTAISAGGMHTCALTQAGGVKCWGHIEGGGLTPLDVKGLTSGVIAISAGGMHTCALTSYGGVKCWGANGFGSLGNGSSGKGYNTPVDVVGLTSGVIAISAGGMHTCALTQAGGVKCWGFNGFGGLGDGTGGGLYDFNAIPVDVKGLTSGVIAISAGGSHTCALTSYGGVKCWGSNASGELGDGTSGAGNFSAIPVDVKGLTSGVIAISAGGRHTCALTSYGGVKCWGSNVSGELGDRTSGAGNFGLPPVNVSELSSGVIAISAGNSHTCALTSYGRVKCWGWNGFSQLGDGTTFGMDNYRSTPVDVVGLKLW